MILVVPEELVESSTKTAGNMKKAFGVPVEEIQRGH
jgi:hypothetical protein